MSELNRCVSLRLLRLPFEPVLFALWIALFPATPKPPEPSVVTWHCRATARMLAVNLAPYLCRWRTATQGNTFLWIPHVGQHCYTTAEQD